MSYIGPHNCFIDCVPLYHLLQDNEVNLMKLLGIKIFIIQMLILSVVFVIAMHLFAADTLTELFLSDLLRPDRKLREFEKCPLALLDKYSSGNHVSRKSRLIHWYYEDQLKKLYCGFIVALNTVSQDSVERNKEKAITATYKLLAGSPEQEAVSERALHKPVFQNAVLLDIVYYLMYF